MKENAQLVKVMDPEEQKKSFRRNFHEMSVASREVAREREKLKDQVSPKVWKAINARLDGDSEPSAPQPGKGYVTNPEDEGLFRQLVFLKHGVTYRQLMVELEKRPTTYRKLLLVHEDYQRLRTGKASLRDLKLKFQFYHFQIIIDGLDFGLATLNEFEFAECFDHICPCRQKHSVEYMKKLRIRVKRAIHQVLESTKEPTTIEFPSKTQAQTKD